MIRKLVVIADDLTGAIDTGVQFLKRNAHVHVLVKPGDTFIEDDAAIDILVINTDSRHLYAAEAGSRVTEAVRLAKRWGADTIYKKTDSVLRGNIGIELETALRESGQKHLAFVPAYPRQNRFTRNGVQYINNIPIDETEFNKDPLDPVTASSINEIIARQSQLPVILIHDGQLPDELNHESSILLFNAESDSELERIAGTLIKHQLRAIAGCAGFAAHLPLSIGNGSVQEEICFQDQRMIVISGSMMKTSLRQLELARDHGFEQIYLQDLSGACRTQHGISAIERILEEHRNGNDLIISMDEDCFFGTADPESAFKVANYLGSLAESLLRTERSTALMIIGGDTLLAALNCLRAASIEPLVEIVSGVVLIKVVGQFGTHLVVTKSGGLGSEDTLLLVRQFIQSHNVVKRDSALEYAGITREI